MALRWCTRRSKLTLGASLESLGIRSLDAIGRLMRCSHRPMGSPRDVGGVLAAEPTCRSMPLPRRAVVASDIRGCGGMACGLGFRTCCYRAWSFLRGGDDDGVVLDVAVHAEDIPLLRALRVTAEPEGDRLPTQESWYRTYRQEMVARFVGRPDLDEAVESHLIFDENGYGPDELARLSEESAARLSAAVISTLRLVVLG